MTRPSDVANVTVGRGRVLTLTDDQVARFWARSSPDDSGCRLWTGRLDRDGYPLWTHHHRPESAHRVAYQLDNGPIPDGLTLDHTCRVRHCIEPSHLEPVTHLVNVQRARSLQTHCAANHELVVLPSGQRGCRQCRAEATRRYRARRRGGGRCPT